MKKQNLNLTTPKLLEYATKALQLYIASEADKYDKGRSHINVTSKGTLSVVFKGYCRDYDAVAVRIGAFDKYPEFVEKLLAMLNRKTGKNYTEENLNIY